MTNEKMIKFIPHPVLTIFQVQHYWLCKKKKNEKHKPNILKTLHSIQISGLTDQKFPALLEMSP